MKHVEVVHTAATLSLLMIAIPHPWLRSTRRQARRARHPGQPIKRRLQERTGASRSARRTVRGKAEVNRNACRHNRLRLRSKRRLSTPRDSGPRKQTSSGSPGSSMAPAVSTHSTRHGHSAAATRDCTFPKPASAKISAGITAFTYSVCPTWKWRGGRAFNTAATGSA
jgi:hypothetical protein